MDELTRFVVSLHVVDVGEAPVAGSQLQSELASPVDAFAASGFLLQYRGVVYFTTAGHVVEQIRDRLRAGRRPIRCRFQDKASGEGRFGGHGIPFELADSPMIWVDDDSIGVDCGLIAIPRHQVRLLLSGGASVVRWRLLAKANEQFHAYAMLGFPNSARSITLRRNAGGGCVSFRDACPMLPLVPASPPNHMRKQYKRRFFRIPPNRGELRGRLISIDRVEGMSGGPIFGFYVSEGTVSARLVGLQSTQSDSGITAVCPIRPFLAAVGKKIEQLRTQEQSPDDRHTKTHA